MLDGGWSARSRIDAPVIEVITRRHRRYI